MTTAVSPWRRVALASYLVLLALTLLWEAWLAPKPHAIFWLSVKLLPLVIFLPGIWRNRPRSQLLACVVVLLYLSEGLVLLWTERTMRPYAWLEVLVALGFIFGTLLQVRARRRQPAES